MPNEHTPKQPTKKTPAREEASRPLQFEPPKLQKRGKLPRVTTAFGGSFVP